MAPKNEETRDDWRNECSDVRQRIEHLHGALEWTDCSFQFSGDSGAEDSNDLTAHKLILALASPVFAAMFYGNVGDKGGPVVVDDIDRRTFTALLRYIYTDKAGIPESDTEFAISLYKAAHKYNLIHLQKECVEFLLKAVEDPNYVCQIYEFTNLFDEQKLQGECLKQFSTKTQLILKSPSFQNADPYTLKKIFSMDSLAIDSEMDLFDALTHYIYKSESDDQNLASQHSKQETDIGGDDEQTSDEANARLSGNKYLPLSDNKPEDVRIIKSLIKGIRFLSMSDHELAKVLDTTLLLSTDEKLALMANLCNPCCKLPMPDGFSTVRDLRVNGKATFRHTFHDVVSMSEEDERIFMEVKHNKVRSLFSPPCYVSKASWKIVAEQTRKGTLALGLLCDYDRLDQWIWSCRAKAELRLLSVCPDTEPKLQLFNGIIRPREKTWGFALEWSQLSDPNNKYIKDGSITVEVQLEIQQEHRENKIFGFAIGTK